MDVEVEVGGWEHECCGDAVERNERVRFECSRTTRDDGTDLLVETHHGVVGTGECVLVEGRVTGIEAVLEDGSRRRVRRLPDGGALRGRDGGPLEDLLTGEVFPSATHEFVVAIRPDAPNSTVIP